MTTEPKANISHCLHKTWITRLCLRPLRSWQLQQGGDNGAKNGAHRASLTASQMASLTLVFMSCVEGMVAQSLSVAATENRWPLGSRSGQSTACLLKHKFRMVCTLLTEDDHSGLLRRVGSA